MEAGLRVIHTIERKLEAVSAELAKDFRELLEAGKVTLHLHPQMVGKCELPFVQDLVARDARGELPFSEYRRLTEGFTLPQPMPEPDAKTLIGLSQKINHALDERLTIVVANNLKNARTETLLVKEAKEYVQDYIERVKAAYTLGLGPDFRAQYTDYGTPIASAQTYTGGMKP